MTTIAERWPLLLLVLSAPARAQAALPAYDSGVYCASLAARTGAGSQEEVHSCLATEARARAGLAPLWSSVPAPIRDRCLHRGQRQSYDLLGICVETEMERSH